MLLGVTGWLCLTVQQWRAALNYRPNAVVQPGEYRLDFKSDAFVRINLQTGKVAFSENTDLDEASRMFWIKVAEHAREEETRRY